MSSTNTLSDTVLSEALDRDEALERIVETLEQNRHLNKKVIVVDGKPCVGKTKFSRYVARKIGAKIVHGDKCYDADGNQNCNVAGLVDSLENEVVIVEETLASEYKLKPLLRICVSVSDEDVRLKAIQRRAREDSAQLLDPEYNSWLNGKFSDYGKFDFVVDNTPVIQEYVSNN